MVLLELEGLCCSCLLAGWYQVSGVWYGYRVVYNFVEDGKLQLCSTGPMCLPSKVVQYIRHAVRIYVSGCHKYVAPSPLGLVRVPDGAKL